jgi:hypothetical protein
MTKLAEWLAHASGSGLARSVELLLLVVCAAGCSVQTAQTGSSSSGSDDSGAFDGPAFGWSLEWRAQVSPVSTAYALTGNAIVHMDVDDHAFRVRIDIRNDAWGTVRPWHVRGRHCSTGGPILGEADWYTPLITDQDGAATISIDVPVALDATNDYHIAVLRAGSDSGTPIACGDLRLE